MKILHLIYDHIHNPWVGGGGAVRVDEIYKRLKKRHDITIACGKYPGAEDYSEGNLRFHFTGTSRNNYILSTFCYAFNAAKFLRNHRDHFNVIIEDFAPYNPVFSFLRRKDAVIHLHQKVGWHHIRKYLILGIPFLIIESIYPSLFKTVITVSDIIKKKFSLAGNIAIISNGFDPNLLTVESSEGDYVLYLGRLHIGQKGLDILLEALKYIKTNLIIAGKGIDEVKIQKLSKKHTHNGNVKMVGFVNGEMKIDILGKCKFLVIPSRYEGESIICLEAAGCGKPVIVSDISELRYAVDAGFGISFKSGDAKDLGEKIKFLLQNNSLRKEMRKKAREFAKNLTWDKVAEEFEKFLLSFKK